MRVKALDLRDDELLELALGLGRGACLATLERLAKVELHVVHDAHARGHRARLLQVVHEREAGRQVGQEHATVALDLGQGEELHDRGRDDAQVALAAEDELRRVDAHALARRLPRPLDDAVRRHDLHIEHQVLDVAVAVLLHAAGIRRDPAAERRELQAVGLVAHHQAVLRERLDDVASRGAGLDAGHAVDGVDPQHPVHAAHVDRDHHARLVDGDAECLGHVRPAAEGQHAGAVRLARLDDRDDLVVALRENDQVRHALKARVAHRPDLAARVAMAAPQADLGVVGDLVGLERLGQRGAQRGARPRRGDLGGVVRLVAVVRAERRGEHLAEPGHQVGQLFLAQAVAVAGEHGGAVWAHDESRVREAPAVIGLAIGHGHRRGRGGHEACVAGGDTERSVPSERRQRAARLLHQGEADAAGLIDERGF